MIPCVIPSDSDILDGLREVARRHLGLERPLAPDMHLAEDLRLDSLQNLTLVLELENRFEVYLELEPDEEVRTVRDLVALLRRHLEAKALAGTAR